jgi:glycosyltransferase involved in cell wall biosynthesis
MRILQVIPVFSQSFGGTVTNVRSISKELAKRHEVTVFTTTALDLKHDIDEKTETINGFSVTYFKRSLKPLCYSGFFGELNLSFDMMRSVKQKLADFDVIHLHSWQQFPDVLIHHFATKYKVPYILQTHGSLPIIGDKRLLKLLFNVTFSNKLLNGAAKMIALTPIEVKQYESMNASRQKIEVVPNGIDLSEYEHLPAKGLFKKKFGIGHDEPVVLYLGRIHQIKGIDFLVKAFVNVLKAVPKARLVIVGPDDGYLIGLTDLVTSLGLSKHVTIVGPLYGEAKLEAYVAASVFVLPSRYEAFSYSVLEAMACGVPMIISKACAISSFLEDNTCLIVDPFNESLELALKNMLLDEKYQRTFSQNVKVSVKQFDIPSTKWSINNA